MKIHSGQPVKMVQSAASPCKDELVIPTCSFTPKSHSPHCYIHRHTSRGLRAITEEEVNTNSRRQQQLAKSQSGEPQDVLDYRECWHLLHEEDVHRQVEHKDSNEKDEMSQESTSVTTPSNTRGRSSEWMVRESRQTGILRGGQRVRHYRKRVSVRWGNLQCSLALVLVVRSRSSSGSCQCTVPATTVAPELQALSPSHDQHKAAALLQA